MTTISLSKSHNKSNEEIESIVEKLEQELAASFQLATQRSGDTLSFKRTGVDGELKLAEQLVSIDIKLGMMMKLMASTLETEIQRKLDKYLD